MANSIKPFFLSRANFGSSGLSDFIQVPVRSRSVERGAMTSKQRLNQEKRLCSPNPAACIKESSPVLEGRAPPHRSRGTISSKPDRAVHFEVE
eukprot:1156824-Pelagomonas_calceolata.AAC.2